MNNLLLKVNLRQAVGRQVKALREKSLIPAVLYGHGMENQNLAVKDNDFYKIYQAAGENTLLDLQVDNQESIKALIQDVQYDPVKHQIIHIDFRQVKMDEKITTAIPLAFIGEAPAIKELGGILVTNLKELEVKCLPVDLVKEIEVDLSNLKSFNDKILVKDLQVNGKIEVLSSPDIAIVIASEPRKIEEIKSDKEEEAAVEDEALAKSEEAEGEGKAEGEKESNQGEKK